VAELALGATQAFGQALSAQAARDAAVAAGTAAEEDLRRARQRRDAGLETDANVLALEVQQARMRAQQIRAESDARIAVVALNQVMGEPLDHTYRLVPPEPEAPGSLDASALESEAVTNRPERAEAAARRDLARASHDMARAALLPHVGFQAGFEFDGSTFGSRASAWVVGTEVSWNVFSGGATRARMREATFAGNRAAAELERLETSIRVEVRSAVARLEAAQASEAVGRAAVAQAIESQRIIRERYDAGMAPASELLRANQARLDAETLRTASVVDLVVSRAALDRALGRQ
jgi:outer membrane protein